jgi:hypothetical protein
MEMPQDRIEPRPPSEHVGAVLTVIGRSLLFPAAGALCAALFLANFYLPRAGIGTVERIAALGRHLNEPFVEHPVAVFLGNSITMEGIDAGVVEETAGNNWHAENLATSGAGPLEFQIVAPKLLKARPDVVVIPFETINLGELVDLPTDKAFAYAYGDFVADWPQDWMREEFGGLSDRTWDALHSTRWEQRLHFRRAPLNKLNDEIRVRLRSGIQETEPTNWLNPYEMLISIQGDRLKAHLDRIKLRNARLNSPDRAGADEIRRLLDYVRQHDVHSVLVAVPVHPALLESVEPYLQELRRLLAGFVHDGTTFVDASELLHADDFGDAIHPNESGRRKYSTLLGGRIAELSIR